MHVAQDIAGGVKSQLFDVSMPCRGSEKGERDFRSIGVLERCAAAFSSQEPS